MNQTTDVSQLTYTHVRGGQFRWVTVTTLLLALGTILHLVSPSIGGITPSWPIATYCAAILLTRPTYGQTLGIGFVAGLIEVMTSKSGFPYGNLLAEPAGALTCALIMRGLMGLKLRYIGRWDIAPVLTGFCATFVSGFIFVTLLWQILGLPLTVYLGGMVPLVAVIAALNGLITPLLYFPAEHLFARRGFLVQQDKISSDHSQLSLEAVGKGIISVESLTYWYDEQKPAVIRDVTLDIQEGDFLVITGPAGCGKSTLCMALTGAVPQFYGGTMQGMVFVDGRAITQMTIPDLANHIGVVLADYDSQLVTMTVKEEVAFAMENRGYDRLAIENQLSKVLGQVGLEGLENRSIASLSGGQRQRLAIASVLVTNPKILVMDEPTSSLDPDGTAELYRLIASLNRDYGMTVVVVDHDLSAALPYANRLVLMVEGQVLNDGAVADTLAYMYTHHIYEEALPPVFTAYMELGARGYSCSESWLSTEIAQKDLEGFTRNSQGGVSHVTSN